jgi:hypothetical protein
MLTVAAIIELVAVAPLAMSVDIMAVAAAIVPLDSADAVPEPDAFVLDAVPVLPALLLPVIMVLLEAAVSMAEEAPWAVTRVALRARRMAVTFILLLLGLKIER